MRKKDIQLQIQYPPDQSDKSHYKWVTTDAEGCFELEDSYEGYNISTSIANSGMTLWTEAKEGALLDIDTQAQKRIEEENEEVKNKYYGDYLSALENHLMWRINLVKEAHHLKKAVMMKMNNIIY